MVDLLLLFFFYSSHFFLCRFSSYVWIPCTHEKKKSHTASQYIYVSLSGAELNVWWNRWTKKCLSVIDFFPLEFLHFFLPPRSYSNFYSIRYVMERALGVFDVRCEHRASHRIVCVPSDFGFEVEKWKIVNNIFNSLCICIQTAIKTSQNQLTAEKSTHEKKCFLLLDF